MKRLAIVIAIVTAAMLIGTAVVEAAGVISAKDGGSFSLRNVVSYPADHTFSANIAPGSTVDTVIVRIPPGGDFGWHYHNEALTVTVTAGVLSLYDPRCDRQMVAPGQGFLEEPGVIHLARNEGSTITVISVTYLGIPAGQAPDVNEPASYDPCPGIN